MDDPRDPLGRPYDLLSLPLSFADIADRSRRLLLEWLARNGFAVGQSAIADPLNIASSFLDLTAKMMANPAKLMRAQMSLWQDYLELWQSTTQRLLGYDGPAVAESDGDRRFGDDIWEENNIFNYVKQSYLLTSRWIEQTVRDVDGMDARTRDTVQFYTRQFVGALSPTNFALTNPEVIRATIETRGENLLAGLRNLLQDLERVQDMLWSAGGDGRPFEIARTIAITPGKVVFRSPLMEVIQYQPTTRTVYRRPLLFVPAWINKYYLFDLGPDNSLVRWAVDQGHTVFMISWANPAGALSGKTFEDYVLEGPVKALDVIRRATGEDEVDAVGYCLGGTLLAATLAYLASRGDSGIRSGTFVTTMLDFSQPGELGAFVDEAAIACLPAGGSGDDSAAAAAMFNLLRENDLVWSFVVNNYLLGRDPFPYDLLYWNADAMRMPLALHGYYLRTFYQQNKLIEPGGISIGGEAIDLRRIQVPTYVLATREDHLAPWKSAYRATQIFGGPSRFTLAASGHVAGVVNPPSARRYCHWTNTRLPPNPEAWLASGLQTEGSWWPDWQAWLVRQPGAGERVPARRPGAGRLPALAEAPGAYVLTHA
jgi:polyhydroxyalkanoate synthase